MVPGLEELRKNYEAFDDRKLIRIASEEAGSLRPEALDLLKQIIKKRGLSTDVSKSIDVQVTKIDADTLLGYTELLRKLPCPVCNQVGEKLNATIISKVMSFLFFSYRQKETKIACPTCLDKLNNNAILITALLGWWGIPHGIIRTPQALIFNSKRKKENHLYEANDLFKSFVSGRVGRIEANRHNPEELEDIIGHIR